MLLFALPRSEQSYQFFYFKYLMPLIFSFLSSTTFKLSSPVWQAIAIYRLSLA